MRRLRASLALAVAGALFMGAPTGAGAVTRIAATDGAIRQDVDRAYALVRLKAAPLATSATTRPPAGRKIDFNSASVKNYRAQLAAQRNEYKAWLREHAPKARVTSEFDVSLNAVGVKLNGHTLAQISGSPVVAQAQYQGLYHPVAHEDPDLGLIDALQAWATGGGAANAGQGVKVAIVDSGIDVTHPCFDDTGYAETNNPGAHEPFTNDKVIVAEVFHMRAHVLGLTPEAIDDHGTHVAGTVACNHHTPAEVDGVDIPYDISGVAPRALLGNYNVFPGHVLSARSEDIANALEAAYADGMDVANMSLGGGSAGIKDLLAMAVNNLDQANMVVAVAAGNSGPGHYTVQSPGYAERALTAGASTVGHFVGAPVTAGGRTYGAASGDFATVTTDLTAPLGVVTGTTNGLSTACSALPAGSVAGEIAVISRGGCTFSTKIRNAQNAGAVVVLVANNVAGDPTAMGSDGSPNQPTVPAYMVSVGTGQALKALDGQPATIDSTLSYFRTGNDDIMAGFSSQGPTDVAFRVKPDVVAPGVNVLSSVTHRSCDDPPCFAFFQGTSMATPHLAGSAAVVKSQHGSWSAAEIRSAIVNTAERGVLKDYRTGTTIVDDVNVIGAGRENLANAVQADVVLDPVSVSFGAIPSGSGLDRTVSVTLRNVSGSAATWPLAVSGTTGSGVTYTVSRSSVTLANGAATTVTITMRAAQGASFDDHQAWLEIGSDGSVAHAAIYTFVK